MQKKLYVPMCLYPHTKYRTKIGLETLFDTFLLSENQYLIILADVLQALDNMVTGRFYSQKSVHIKARRDAEQIARLVKKVAKSRSALSTGKIVFWDDIAQTQGYINHSTQLREAILSVEHLSQEINSFIMKRIERFGLGASLKKEYLYEQDYILSEICMSTYCIEVLGYHTEVWERPLKEDAPDPLKILYAHHSNLLEGITGHPPKRNLQFLFRGTDEK